MKEKKSKYRLTKELAISLIEENIEAITFFLEKMDKPEYKKFIEEYRPNQSYYFNKLKQWNGYLKEMKENADEFIDEEVRQLTVTLYWVVYEYLGFHTKEQISEGITKMYFTHQIENEEFIKDFDEAYLKLFTTHNRMHRIYLYTKENFNDTHGIETVEEILEKEKIDVYNDLLTYLNETETPKPRVIKLYISYLGYDEGIELIHKLNSPTYTVSELKDIINSRLEIKRSKK